MKYISTRNNNIKVSAAEAIVSGLAPDGGLFLPESVPAISMKEIVDLSKKDYPERAADVLGRFLTDFTPVELAEYTQKAYNNSKFSANDIAPLTKLTNGIHILELFHGPTCAFKDFALQILPYLLTASIKKSNVDKTVIILVATSGDTGKAALEGFADVDGTKICVFFPEGGTSSIQRKQMVTQDGANVMVAAVKGNFDDAQNGVKAIFTDKNYAAQLAEKGYQLSSANSINWGRLVPQIAYYFSAYCDLINSKDIHPGDQINITVPTGNFGNILAAYYAKLCGLPVAKLICASNRNSVLTDFITTGIYNCNRPFYLTNSPSMDILISSNLERLLYLLSGGNDTQIRTLMNDLATKGKYTISPEMLSVLQNNFICGSADDTATAETICDVFERSGYICDTHTAVGFRVYEDYRNRSGDRTTTVLAATASPFKFCSSVLPALGQKTLEDDFAMLNMLSRITGCQVPHKLSELANKPERFTKVVSGDQMKNVINSLL